MIIKKLMETMVETMVETKDKTNKDKYPKQKVELNFAKFAQILQILNQLMNTEIHKPMIKGI